MKGKTALRLEKRLERLPLHHIDTSVILEPKNTENGLACRRYLQKVGYNYSGKVSFPVLSELLFIILRIEDYSIKHDLFDAVDGIIASRDIDFYVPVDIFGITDRIKALDYRIDPMDRQIVACAVEDRASILVTLDSKLIHSEKLEEEFKIKIRHPKELL